MSPKPKAPPKRRVRTPRAAAGPAYLAELRALIELVNATGISDLEVQSAGRTFRIGRNGAPQMAPMMAMPGPFQGLAAAPAAPAAPAAAPPEAQKKLLAIKSPIVGTFYRAPAPDADPYIEEGNRVGIGQTVCIVEAMKLMNEIQSEVSGKVARICVQNGQPVEYGQDLFLVDPEG